MSELEQQQLICIHREWETKICLEPTCYKAWSVPISNDTQQEQFWLRNTCDSYLQSSCHCVVGNCLSYIQLRQTEIWSDNQSSRSVSCQRVAWEQRCLKCHWVHMCTMSVLRRTVAFSLWVYWKYVLFILSKAPSFSQESLAFLPSPGTLGEWVALFHMAGETFSDLKDKWLCAVQSVVANIILNQID